MRTRALRLMAFAVSFASLGLAPAFGETIAVRFVLTTDGVEIASFTELGGIVSEVEPSEFTISGNREAAFKKLPKKARPGTVTLRRGMTTGVELWEWHDAVRLGNVAAARRSCSLVGFDQGGTPVVRLLLEKAWPSRVELATRGGEGAQELFESVTLVAEYIRRVSP